jgi:hypothetical protein
MHGGEKELALKERFMAEVRTLHLRLECARGLTSRSLLLAFDFPFRPLQLARTPAFRLDDIFDLSKDELRERTMEKFSTMGEPCSSLLLLALALVSVSIPPCCFDADPSSCVY